MSERVNVRRRQVLIAGAALAAASSGALWLAMKTRDPADWIEAVVRKHLPGVQLEVASLHTFAQRLADDPRFKGRKVALAMQLDRFAAPLVRVAPEIDEKIARLERLVLTDYLASSNFFRVADPRAEKIVCHGELPACGNPFAVFRNE